METAPGYPGEHAVTQRARGSVIVRQGHVTVEARVTVLMYYQDTGRSLESRSPAGWINWLKCCLLLQKVVGSMPSRGTYGRQPIDVSLSP